jgi:hypothetical protein
MIKADVCHHGDTAVPSVHRVESPAKSDLNNGAVDAFGAESVKDDTGEQLKLGDWPYARFNSIGGIERSLNRDREWE